jgi:hypothetical protein
VAVVIRSDDSITVREVDGEILVLDLRSNQVHQFNQTASFIWKCCGQGMAPDVIAAALAAEFDVDGETARRDVEDTLFRLRTIDLLEIGHPIE